MNAFKINRRVKIPAATTKPNRTLKRKHASLWRRGPDRRLHQSRRRVQDPRPSFPTRFRASVFSFAAQDCPIKSGRRYRSVRPAPKAALGLDTAGGPTVRGQVSPPFRPATVERLKWGYSKNTDRKKTKPSAVVRHHSFWSSLFSGSLLAAQGPPEISMLQTRRHSARSGGVGSRGGKGGRSPGSDVGPPRPPALRRWAPSPFLRGPQLLRVSVRALGAGVQLDEELGELALGEHGLQQALQEDVHQPPVQLLVLEHLEDAQDALPGGVRADDVLQLVCAPQGESHEHRKWLRYRWTEYRERGAGASI